MPSPTNPAQGSKSSARGGRIRNRGVSRTGDSKCIASVLHHTRARERSSTARSVRRRDGELPVHDGIAVVLVAVAVDHAIEPRHALIRNGDLPGPSQRDRVLYAELVL